MRNGVITDRYRRAGSHFKIIFGLNLPQLTEIAADYGHDPELAAQLWANTSTRESMLLATMLYRADDFTGEQLESLARDIDDIELADIACLKLLRHHPGALEIARRMSDSSNPIYRYTALRLMFNLLADNLAEAERMALAESRRDDPMTRRLAAQLLDECEFRKELQQTE